MEIIKENIKEIILAILILITIIMQGVTIFILYNNKEQTIEEPLVEDIKQQEKEEKQIYQVDIKGEVKKPGTYKIESDKRVIDVISQAGGLTKNADTSANNLSRKVTDEMVIIIYSKKEIENFSKVQEKENIINSNCNKETSNIKNDSCITSKKEEQQKKDKDNNKLVSINKASLEELMTITGIGESKAKNIIEYRNQNGEFKSTEEIQNVSGIGAALYDKIKNYITL